MNFSQRTPAFRRPEIRAVSLTVFYFFLLRALASAFEDVHPLSIAASDLLGGGFGGDCAFAKRHDRFEKSRPADRETSEGRDFCRDPQPFEDLFLILAASQHNAADLGPPVPPGAFGDLHTILFAIQAFDLPDVCLHARVLNLADGSQHEAGPQLAIVDHFVATDLLQLSWLCGDQELEHVQPPVLMAAVAEPLEAGALPAVKLCISLRVIADQHFDECWF